MCLTGFTLLEHQAGGLRILLRSEGVDQTSGRHNSIICRPRGGYQVNGVGHCQPAYVSGILTVSYLHVLVA